MSYLPFPGERVIQVPPFKDPFPHCRYVHEKAEACHGVALSSVSVSILGSMQRASELLYGCRLGPLLCKRSLHQGLCFFVRQEMDVCLKGKCRVVPRKESIRGLIGSCDIFRKTFRDGGCLIGTQPVLLSEYALSDLLGQIMCEIVVNVAPIRPLGSVYRSGLLYTYA